MVLLSSAQWRTGLFHLVVSAALAKSGECSVDEIRGNERRVRRGRACAWSKVSTEDGPANR